jgi:hypothetical protein
MNPYHKLFARCHEALTGDGEIIGVDHAVWRDLLRKADTCIRQHREDVALAFRLARLYFRLDRNEHPDLRKGCYVAYRLLWPQSTRNTWGMEPRWSLLCWMRENLVPASNWMHLRHFEELLRGHCPVYGGYKHDAICGACYADLRLIRDVAKSAGFKVEHDCFHCRLKSSNQ